MDAKSTIETTKHSTLYGCCSVPAKEIVVAGGAGLNKVAYSFDGKTWYPSTTGNALFGDLGTCTAVGYNSKIWVIGGNYKNNSVSSTGSMGYSMDGITWVSSPSNVFGASGNCFTVASNGQIWLAGGNGSTNLAYSSDGISWTSLQSLLPVSSYCYSLAWNGTVWVAGLGNSYSTPLAWSTDPTSTWNLVTNPFGGSPDCHCVFYSQGQWLASANNASNNILATSTDGKTWTGISKTNQSGAGSECHVVSSNCALWLIGVGTQSLMYSGDGIVFTTSLTAKTLFGNGTGHGYSLLWTGAFWIAGGDDLTSSRKGKILYSKDGITWESTQGTNLFAFHTFSIGDSEGSVRTLATNFRKTACVITHPKFSSYSEYYVWKRVNAQKHDVTWSPCNC